MAKREVTLRRTLEQITHCAEEALAVVSNSEDHQLAIDDLAQARQLIDIALVELGKRRDIFK